jgi:predicted dehydrogenase
LAEYFNRNDGNKQAAWRTNPSKSGISGCMGDIGTHAAQLAEYISGLKITKLCADINIVVEGRKLDDDGNVLPNLIMERMDFSRFHKLLLVKKIV